MPRVHVPVLVTVALAAVSVVACSSSGGPARSSSLPATSAGSGASSSVASSSVAGPVSTSAPASDASSSGTAGTSACAESQLRASVTPQNIPGLNRHVVRLVFTNTSTSACTLTGYPGAAIVESSGTQVQQAKRVVGGPVAGTVERVATLTVQPGMAVFAYLEGQSTRQQGAAQAGCDGPKYPRILVTPPNTTTAVPFTVGWPQCYAFDVHPVRDQ